MNNKSKVFLGGTCNESTWRDELIKNLKIDYFNPVVDDWTEECMIEERRQRILCDYCLYVLTPRMSGLYSIAEVVDDSNKRPKKTILCILDIDDIDLEKENCGYFYGVLFPDNKLHFHKYQLKSLDQIGKMVERNNGKYFRSLEEVAEYLNR